MSESTVEAAGLPGSAETRAEGLRDRREQQEPLATVGRHQASQSWRKSHAQISLVCSRRNVPSSHLGPAHKLRKGVLCSRCDGVVPFAVEGIVSKV
jgi:hypothetical protein